MRNSLFSSLSILLASALLAGSACSLKINVPPGQVLCKADTDCPSGAVCEAISQDAAPITVSVCCLKPGCTAHLSDETVMNAAIAAGYRQDASSSETSVAAEVSISAEVGIAADALVGPEAEISWDSGVGPEAQTSPDGVVGPDVQTSPDVIVATDVLAAADVLVSPDVLFSTDAVVVPDGQVVLFGPDAHADVSLLSGEVGLGNDGGPNLDAVSRDGPIETDGPSLKQCKADGECSTGHCGHGFCCKSECNGTCQSCLAVYTGLPDGTCGPTLPDKPYSDCVAQPATSCGDNGFCDGQGACAKYSSKTKCGTASCNISNTYNVPLCDGAGSCTSVGTYCGVYMCSVAEGCALTCAKNSDCLQPNYHCDVMSSKCSLGCTATSCPNGSSCVGSYCESNDGGTID